MWRGLQPSSPDWCISARQDGIPKMRKRLARITALAASLHSLDNLRKFGYFDLTLWQ